MRPKSKVSPVQSYDDVVLSASGTTVIGATGRDTNSPPILEKSKGTATTAQEVDGGNGDKYTLYINNLMFLQIHIFLLLFMFLWV